MTKLFAVLAALVVLAGCGGQDEVVEDVEQNMEGEVVYDCNGENVSVTFDNTMSPGVAQLSFVDRDHTPIMLTQVESASGAKYIAGDIVFWTQQDTATLSVDDMENALSCELKDNAMMEDDISEEVDDEMMQQEEI